MKAVAAAYQARSLQAFQDTLATYKAQLVDDAFVNAHLTVRIGRAGFEQELVRPTEAWNTVMSHVSTSARICRARHHCGTCGLTCQTLLHLWTDVPDASAPPMSPS